MTELETLGEEDVEIETVLNGKTLDIHSWDELQKVLGGSAT